MRVFWRECFAFPMAGDDFTNEFCSQLTEQRVVEHTYMGDVIHTYRNFFGVPKFVVALDNMEIVTVRCDRCKIIKR